ncbi:hypothetical protein DW070_14330 [Coprococcus catus]|uniref:Uncharacterized protein n=2 Tax=Coprococcus catus TaxID=116085 RepID=A0A3E2TGF1_9FIRM|nr:hypothetical protein DW070_14330 [Coprococcus catus]
MFRFHYNGKKLRCKQRRTKIMAENRYELNKQQLAISFHPELDGDNRLHQYFVQMVSSSLNKEK